MDWLRSSVRRAHKFTNLSPAQRRLAVRAFFLLIVVRFALWVLPFTAVARWVGNLGKKYKLHANGLSPHQLTSLISSAADYVPGASCLTQALVSHVVLSLCGYTPLLKIGVAKSVTNQMEAHAWVEWEGKVIIGQLGDLERFTQLQQVHARLFT